jgi:uncharacterized radical SAM superfamily Fe-S cluster-containing enzyme
MKRPKIEKLELWSTSICPVCLKKIPMKIFEENRVMYLEKKCDEHGKFEDVYWGDAELYKWFFENWNKASYMGRGLENPRTETKRGCPFDCGICPQHKTHTVLGIIDITNRCNMACPICFAHAGAANYVYEPSYKQIVNMIKNLRANSPWSTNALQFSGGEPTLRNDLPDLIKEAKKAGITHVEVNTNGIRLSEDLDYFKKLIKAGLDTIYLQFDGLKDEIYKKLRGRKDTLSIKKKVIENARKLGMNSIVLVVTLAKGVNDNELGNIIQYAVDNKDVIRCVNIQPISMAGRAKKDVMRKLRITIPDTMKLIEKQSDGIISRWDWRPVNWPLPVAKGMGVLNNKMYPEFTMHPHCGASTFLVVEKDGSFKPITKYVDVDKFAGVFWNIYYLGINGKKTRAKIEAFRFLPMIKSKLIRSLLKGVMTKGNYEALGNLMGRVIMIGIMHFQDVWNFDIDRVQRCAIHYSLPDGTIRSFCTYNSLYRQDVEKKYAIPMKQWIKKNRKKLVEYN